MVAIISNYQKVKRPSKKGLINIQSIDDNECVKCCFARYLHPADHNTARIIKNEKIFESEFNFKDAEFPIKIRDICEIEKRNCISISVFDHENKEKYPIYVSKIFLKSIMIYY